MFSDIGSANKKWVSAFKHIPVSENRLNFTGKIFTPKAGKIFF